jgi:hypothetical protein
MEVELRSNDSSLTATFINAWIQYVVKDNSSLDLLVATLTLCKKTYAVISSIKVKNVVKTTLIRWLNIPDQRFLFEIYCGYTRIKYGRPLVNCGYGKIMAKATYQKLLLDVLNEEFVTNDVLEYLRDKNFEYYKLN